jgi:16S rRNA (adenine1518-N6/adenine1519-N6)-dimethyltransferase
MTSFVHKKRLGQNFLVNTDIVDQIIAHAKIQVTDNILEIGPGQGVLTQQLALKAHKVIAVEIDDRLISGLKERFSKNEQVEIIHDDILATNLVDLLSIRDIHEYKVIANIPYYITAPIIRLFLEAQKKPQEIILMVQKEVGERLSATAGSMSILAFMAQYYADVEYLFTVSREEFDPKPAVDSAVVRLSVKKDPDDLDKNAIFRTVKIGFSSRRKKLVNNLVSGYHIDKSHCEDILHKCDISVAARAQELSIDQWKKLAHRLGDQ